MKGRIHCSCSSRERRIRAEGTTDSGRADGARRERAGCAGEGKRGAAGKGAQARIGSGGMTRFAEKSFREREERGGFYIFFTTCVQAFYSYRKMTNG